MFNLKGRVAVISGASSGLGVQMAKGFAKQGADLVILARREERLIELKKELEEKGVKVYNLGTGKGTSVLELVNAFEKVNNITINKKIAPRRPGDIDSCYAACDKAFKELGFKAEKTVDEMCRDSYNFVKNND